MVKSNDLEMFTVKVDKIPILKNQENTCSS